MSLLQVILARVNPFNVKKSYRLLLFLRCITGGTGMICFFIGLKYIPSSKAALIMNIHPILVAIAAFFILKESITKLKILAVCGAFCGVILFTWNENKENGKDSYAVGIILVSVTCC